MAEEWKSTHAYSYGDRVTIYGITRRCIAAGTSFQDAPIEELWTDPDHIIYGDMFVWWVMDTLTENEALLLLKLKAQI
jgi:hypothetical protein